MELRVLKYFLIVAREENITRAAVALHVTQPTLSRQLMQLEEELGVTLFKRGGHRVTLTEDGMLLRRRAQEIVELAEKTARDFSRVQSELTGEISIGGGETQSVSSLAEKIASFHENHPQVRFQMFSANADSIKERIENGLLDIGLLVEPVDISRYEFLRMKDREVWGVLAREDSELAKKAAVTPVDLRAVPLLISGRTLIQSELTSWFGEDCDRLNVAATYNLLYNAAMLVRAGIGVALCIKLDCDYRGLRFVPLSPALDMGSVIVWKKDQARSPAVSAFIEYIKVC